MFPRLWNGNASTIACHYDQFDNLACLIAGKRRFTHYLPDTRSGISMSARSTIAWRGSR
ncbi:cupin-like domain-containing protein [Sphingomonas elodea]|uniref:cupin-like domain-containing protein n=1 Tax=Sphingomonas elodea TaxID=179878 RepID=UPI000316132C|nr:cupin-like domain-containing protein [Sphingomonas elodea]